MKKISSIFMACIGLVSCDFDQYSPNSLPFEKGFETIGNIQALERGAYASLRTAVSPECMIVPDLQADYANAVYGYSNTYGGMYEWTFTQEESEVEAVWQNFYGGIGQFNFIIDGIDFRLARAEADGEELPADEVAEMNRIKGNMFFMRALSYSILAERFCADYDESTADREYSGLPLVLKYDPDGRPSRSTLRQVYVAISDDLKEARRLLADVPGGQDATTFNIDCVTALEARVLLQTDNTKDALAKANLLISNPTYSLVETAEDFGRMWEYDKSTETIFQFFVSKTEVAYQWGIPFWVDDRNGLGENGMRLMVADYIPTADCVSAFSEGDWRAAAYFRQASGKQPIDGRWVLPYIKGHGAFADNLTLISKYPGNPDLRSTAQWNYVNTYKVFRLAEQYLIAAEAAIAEDADAATPLNALRQHRGLEPLPEVTLADVQAERYREMMLEGTRLTDLKRWGLGVSRKNPQTGILSETGGNPWFKGSFVSILNAEIEKTKDDYMMVWPVPASEIFSNPVLSGQQNPGWER